MERTKKFEEMLHSKNTSEVENYASLLCMPKDYFLYGLEELGLKADRNGVYNSKSLYEASLNIPETNAFRSWKIMSSAEVMLANLSIFGKHDKRNRSSYKTYLMVDGRTKMVKIGRSSNPLLRESTLQSQNPLTDLIAICDENVEKELHTIYKKYRVRGEWFNLSKEEIDMIIKDYGFIDIRSYEN